MATGTRSIWPSAHRLLKARPRSISNTDRRRLSGREGPDEPEDLVGEGLRSFGGKEMPAGEEAQLGAQELRERTGDRVDGQVAVGFAPQHQRRYARGSQGRQARGSFARLESAGRADEAQAALRVLVRLEHPADRVAGKAGAAHATGEDWGEPVRLVGVPSLDAPDLVHRPLVRVHAVGDDQPARARRIGGDEDLRRGRSDVVRDEKRRVYAERVEQLSEPSRLPL